MRTANFIVEVEYGPTGEYFSTEVEVEFDDLAPDEDEFESYELEGEAYAYVMEQIVVTPTFTGWSN